MIESLMKLIDKVLDMSPQATVVVVALAALAVAYEAVHARNGGK